MACTYTVCFELFNLAKENFKDVHIELVNEKVKMQSSLSQPSWSYVLNLLSFAGTGRSLSGKKIWTLDPIFSSLPYSKGSGF